MRQIDLTIAPARLPARFGVWLVAAAAALFMLVRLFEPMPLPEAPIRQSGAGAAGYAVALEQTDRKLEGLRRLVQSRPEDWLMQERIAHQLMLRARLTGSFADYAEAQRALNRGFASAKPGAGPHLTQAALALSLHRLGLAEQMLDAVDRYAVPSEAEVRSGVSSMRGDIALYRGQYARSVASYLQLTKQGDRPDQRLAIFWSRTGRADDALAAIRRVERTGLVPGQSLAQLALLRGTIELQRGHWDAAETAFDDADRRFPGFWLTKAHLAQMLALRGRHAAAIRAFKLLAMRSDDPMLRDAVASLYRAHGNYAAAQYWSEQASQGWAARLRLIPEAAFGHAAEHELAFGTRARALDLARRDFALRPHGATAIALGWALLANNRPAAALDVIDAVNRSSWQSAEQHLVAARAHAMLGQSDAADTEQDKALAINPRALDPSATLLWYGH